MFDAEQRHQGSVISIASFWEFRQDSNYKRGGRYIMFPFFGNPCWSGQSYSRQEYRQQKLRFLKTMRDELETRLAGLNAAIETMERQMSQPESTSSNS